VLLPLGSLSSIENFIVQLTLVVFKRFLLMGTVLSPRGCLAAIHYILYTHLINQTNFLVIHGYFLQKYRWSSDSFAIKYLSDMTTETQIAMPLVCTSLMMLFVLSRYK
jgi:hypothetical protein